MSIQAVLGSIALVLVMAVTVAGAARRKRVAVKAGHHPAEMSFPPVWFWALAALMALPGLAVVLLVIVLSPE